MRWDRFCRGWSAPSGRRQCFGNGLVVLAAIRRRAADQAGQQVDDRGKNAVFDHADAAAGGRIGLEPVAEGIQNILHHGVGIVVVVAVMVHLVAVDQLIKPLMALPVFQQGIIEFLRGAFFSSYTTCFRAVRESAVVAGPRHWMPVKLYRAPPCIRLLPLSVQSRINVDING